jgi:hypothetical protein
MRGWWIPVRRREPFPAIVRRVSGRKMMIAMIVRVERIKRKMKMNLGMVSTKPI